MVIYVLDLDYVLLPGVEALRAMGGRHGQVPLVHTYIADCETPVSAFLKLRDGGPAFLLESVEQGRLGRYSMIGVRPQAVIRGAGGELVQTGEDGEVRSLDASDPFGAVEDAVDRVGMAPPRRAPRVLGRGRGLLRLRPRAHGRAPARTSPPTTSASPTWWPSSPARWWSSITCGGR